MLRLLGYLFSTIPAVMAVAAYFPVLRERGEGETAVSLGALFLLVIALLPLWRGISAFFRSPSAPKIWLALFLFFYLTGRIAAEMVVISTVGLLGSLVGLVFFRIAALKRKRQVTADERTRV